MTASRAASRSPVDGPLPEPARDAPALSTGAVARRFGVSPTTLRSWDRRYGLGPATREQGRHRRWEAGDLAVLEEMCRLTALGTPPAEAARAARATAGRPLLTDADQAVPAPRRPAAESALSQAAARRESRGLARAAVRLDAAALDELLARLVAEHGLVTSWEEVIVPTLRAVGRKWEGAGDPYVAVEHLLSWHVSSALRRVAPVPQRFPRAAPVVLACVPGEQHTLPVEALAAGLGERGLPVRVLGGAVPVEALDETVRRTGPAAVLLWSQSRATASGPLARHLAAIAWGIRGARTRPEVLQAGPGWSGRPLAAALRPRGLREALDALSGCFPG